MPLTPGPNRAFGHSASCNCAALTVQRALVDPEPEWRNWQTREIQNLVPARECGFESHLWQSSSAVNMSIGRANPSGGDADVPELFRGRRCGRDILGSVSFVWRVGRRLTWLRISHELSRWCVDYRVRPAWAQSRR